MKNIQSAVKSLPLSCCHCFLYHHHLLFSVCLCVGQLQQSLLAFGRSTRKLMRDVMEEQQRALDILSGQVKGGAFR